MVCRTEWSFYSSWDCDGDMYVWWWRWRFWCKLYQWNLYPQWWPNSRPGRVNGLTERWRLDPNSPGSPSRRVGMATWLFRSAPGEAQCPISFLLRYGDVWTDWRTTTNLDAGKEQSFELSAKEDIVAISGYSLNSRADTASLQAESSAGRSWGPHGRHTPLDGYRSLRSSPDAPTNGLKLNHLSGDRTKNNYILRWLHQYNQMKTWMIVCICIVFYMIGDCLHISLLWIAFIIPPPFKSSNY